MVAYLAFEANSMFGYGFSFLCQLLLLQSLFIQYMFGNWKILSSSLKTVKNLLKKVSHTPIIITSTHTSIR